MTTEELRGKFYPTSVGSLPYKDPKVACEKILNNFKEVPFWPQLIKRSFLENMYVQFSQGFPGVVVDLKEKKIYCDTSKGLSAQIEALYEKFLAEDVEYFSIGPDYAAGFYEMTRVVKAASVKPKFLKGQITGPISFGLTVTDEKRRSIFYNTELKEALVKTLAMKAAWQARKIKEAGVSCIIFVDEPYLSSLGSSFINVNRQDAVSAINEVIVAIHKEGALSGIHCCGNTDWGLILGTQADIINFDAYNFSESLSLYPKELKAFLKRGGVLAWGIVPNTKEILKENSRSLSEKFKNSLKAFSDKGIEKEEILSSMMITPSCGLGLLDEYIADMVLEGAAGLSAELKN